MKSVFLLFLILLFSFGINAQNFVRGKIIDERKTPIPFAKIFVKNSADQRTVADADGKYELSLMPGEYFLVFSALGYKTGNLMYPFQTLIFSETFNYFQRRNRITKKLWSTRKKETSDEKSCLKWSRDVIK